MPPSKTLPKLTQAFYTMSASGEDNYRLFQKGTEGAAWTAAYACDLLGLECCIVTSKSGKEIVVPISSGHEEAKVIIYITEVPTSATSIELCLFGQIEELIRCTTYVRH